MEWVEQDLKVVFEEDVLPTYALFSNQRYSEYMQMWESMDNNNNLKLNFKVITRDNNPKEGTMYSKKGNSPTATKYLMKHIEALNDAGKLCMVECRMKQPVTIDFNYKITLVTNKYELLNQFNMMVVDKFNSLQAYVFPNGHPMPMKLKNITDESEYNVDDRQYFAQTFEITLMGYFITEDDFDIEVKPIVSLHCIGGEVQKRKPRVEIEEFELIDTCETEKMNRYYKQPIKITIGYDDNNMLVSEFIIDCNMNINKIYGENVRTHILKVNEEIAFFDDGEIRVQENDVLNIKIKKINNSKESVLFLEGYSPDIIYDSKKDLMESELDAKNISQEIIIQ